MNTLIHNVDRDCVNSLGIPVDNLTREGAVERIVELAKRRDGRARLVSTLNVDFLVNALGTGFQRARHPELLEVLRQSDLVTADGFPILWLSRIAGRPLPHRVCGSDMVPSLAARAVQEGLSLFLLGGGEGVGARAAETLRTQNPGLRIAGTAAPMIHSAGPGLTHAEEDDVALVEAINRSGADILLLGLGNPKQELWFNRNRHRLEVPVSIGVGGTFEFIVGSVRRAPAWMQRCNLEWVFRMTQDPARLWRRYALGLAKMVALSLPLAWSRLTQRLAFGRGRRALPSAPQWRQLWSSRDDSLAVVRLPRLVARDYLENLVREVQTTLSDGTLRLLDFSRVKHIALEAHHALFTLSELQRLRNDRIVLLGMSDELRRRLASARVLDMLQTTDGDALSSLDSGRAGAGTGCRTYLLEQTALVFLSGRVDARGLADMGFVESLRQTATDRLVIIDVRNVDLLESTAIVALMSLHAGRGDAAPGVYLSGASPNVRQMFRMANLGAPARFLDDAGLLALIAGEEPGHD
ncbi:MAG: WecB/TagA/CpsF family glycosyltransferase [Xanthomonadales bacterium]|nr:WecB/TagA/CpsF family glycosyltransferase [Xanthomonadales bacterium]